MFSVAAKRASVLVWGVITDFSRQVLQFCEILGPSWMHCFFEGYPKISRRLWRHFPLNSRIVLKNGDFVVARTCWKLLIIPSLCERIKSTEIRPREPNLPGHRLHEKSGARCCPNVVTCLTFLYKPFLTLTLKVNKYFLLLSTMFVS